MRPRAVGSLRQAARLERSKVLDGAAARQYGAIRADTPVLIILAAGKGTRFGAGPEVHPAGLRHTIGPPLHRRLPKNHSVPGRSASSATATRMSCRRWATTMSTSARTTRRRHGLRGFRGVQCPGTAGTETRSWSSRMGDRIVAPGIFRQLCETHDAGPREADLTLLTAIYEPPKNRGKGRIVRDAGRRCYG